MRSSACTPWTTARLWRQAVKAAADAAASAAAALAAAFCATRPPRHHAGADFMGGYCFLNNTAVAQSLLTQGCERVVILDVGFHHGNGTQIIFYERADVLFGSLHGDPSTECPFYLGQADERGAGAGLGFNLNLPMPAGCISARWFEALGLDCRRVAEHGASALVLSLGLDTFAEDPISKFSLLSDDFQTLGQRIGKLGLPTVFVLEGGYATKELGRNAVNVLDGFEQV